MIAAGGDRAVRGRFDPVKISEIGPGVQVDCVRSPISTIIGKTEQLMSDLRLVALGRSLGGSAWQRDDRAECALAGPRGERAERAGRPPR
jgi:hypothetical protein